MISFMINFSLSKSMLREIEAQLMWNPTLVLTNELPISQTKSSTGSQSMVVALSTRKQNPITISNFTMIMVFSSSGTASGISTFQSTPTNLYKISVCGWVHPTDHKNATLIIDLELISAQTIGKTWLGIIGLLWLRIGTLLVWWLPMVSLTMSLWKIISFLVIISTIIITPLLEFKIMGIEKIILIGLTSEDILIT